MSGTSPTSSPHSAPRRWSVPCSGRRGSGGGLAVGRRRWAIRSTYAMAGKAMPPASTPSYRDAFPDEDLLPLVRELMADPERVLSLVATARGAAAAHIAFTACGIDGRPDKVALLGPLAVAPDRQRQGVGRAGRRGRAAPSGRRWRGPRLRARRSGLLRTVRLRARRPGGDALSHSGRMARRVAVARTWWRCGWRGPGGRGHALHAAALAPAGPLGALTPMPSLFGSLNCRHRKQT